MSDMQWFEEKLLEVKRVTKVTTWWRVLSFRATILIWNKQWVIGLWVWKWSDVTIAIKKATRNAYKQQYTIPLTDQWSVLYPLEYKYKSCIVRLLPAAPGTWLKAWSSVRLVLELVWCTNILSKIIGSNNILNNALATIRLLSSYKQSKTKKTLLS